MNTDILKNRYFLALIALAIVGAAGFNALQTQPSEPLEDTFDISVPVGSQSMSDSTFSVPDVFSFGVDGAVNPEDRVTYSTGLRFYPEGDFCSENPDYNARYAVWLEGEGLSQDYNAWKENGETVYIGCDGSYTDVDMTINAPQTIGEYEYKVMAAKYNIITQYPVFDNKFNFADSRDTLKVTEPIEQPTSRLSLSTHSAEIGDAVSVATQSSGDITEETLRGYVDGESSPSLTLTDFHEMQSTSVELDEAGEWRFELETEYQGEEYYSDTDSATVQVDGYEEADSEIQTDRTAEKGDTITLDGSRSNGEGSLSYTWYVNGNEVAYSSTTEYQVQSSGTTLSVELEIEDQVGQTDIATTSIDVAEEETNDGDDTQGETETVYIGAVDAGDCSAVQSDKAPTDTPVYDTYQKCVDAFGFDDGNDDDNDGEEKSLIEQIVDFLTFWK